MKNSRGITIPETLVYAVLLLVVLGGVYAGFSVGRNTFSSVRSGSEVNQEAMKGVLGLERELSHAEPTTILTSNNPAGVRFLSALPEDGGTFTHTPEGRLQWQRWVGIYLAGDGRLLSKSQPITPTAELPDPNTWPEVSALAANTNLEMRVLAHNVSEVSFPDSPPELFRVSVQSRTEESRFSSGRSNTATDKAIFETTYQGEIPLRNRAPQ